jgi:hypothetical protein
MKILNHINAIIFLASTFFCPLSANASTHNAISCSSTDVNSVITQAVYINTVKEALR